MGDEKDQAEQPASGATPSQPTPEKPAPEPPAEEKPEGAGEKPPEAATEPAAPEATGAQAAPEAPAAPAEEPPKPEPPPPPPNYDGLDSGLAWFGYERFQPPAPVGYQAPPEEAARPPKELSAEDRRRIRGRFAVIRKEAEILKAWYHKIPMGVLSMVPILIILAIYVIVNWPWQAPAFPESKDNLDEKVLSATPVADLDAALERLGVREATPANCWRVLPDNIVKMASVQDAAKLIFAPPKEAAKLEIACDLCVLDRDPNAWGATIMVDQAQVMALKAHPDTAGSDYVAGRRGDGSLAGYQHAIKPRTWNQLKVTIGDKDMRYAFNGKELSATAPRPHPVTKIELTTYNAQLLVRNWRIQTLD
ncbi:MAG: hypothetical protein FJ291_22040 [Planctomycetes bacterium]|nr:hypothetical protein [Planctomycetota bacterium]